MSYDYLDTKFTDQIDNIEVGKTTPVTGMNGILQEFMNNDNYLKKKVDTKLDKGDVSEDYNTAKKIEDKIKGTGTAESTLWTGSVMNGTISLSEEFTNYKYIEITTDYNSFFSFRTSTFNSQGELRMPSGAYQGVDPSGDSLSLSEAPFVITTTNSTTLTTALSRTGRNRVVNIIRIVGHD